jgi:hypothetical protein
VVFIDFAGEVIDKLPGFELAGNPGATGVWLERGRTYFRLAPRRGLLTPVARQRASSLIHKVRDVPKLPAPEESRVKGFGVVGRWWYGFPPVGDVTLAQWLGECEAATAYWVAIGARAEIITGGHNLSLAPQSIALGWSPSGDAVVLLEESGCGLSSDVPGVYLFSSPGAGSLLFPAGGYTRAEMWSRT